MTEQIIKSKKFKMLVRLKFLWALCLSASAFAAGSSAPKLPLLQQVGAIPVQWEESATADQTYNIDQAKQWINKAFPEAVRSSRRFRVLNDDLISNLWKDAQGRLELQNQFELQALVGLNAAIQGDGLTIAARLLSPEMATMLLESERWPLHWVASADQAAITDKVEQLVFRLFNRIPVDVSVSSVQGAFITLSGGSEQGVEVGDKVDIVRTRIKSLHPATGSWLAFDSEHLGSANVVDVKNFTSIAKIQQLTYDGAVEVGDGAKIAAIAARVKFARMSKKPDFRDSGDQKTIIVPPLYTTQQDPQAAPDSQTKQQTGNASSESNLSGATSKNSAASPNDTKTSENTTDAASTAPSESSPDASGDKSFWSDFNFQMPSIGDKVVDDLTIYGGAYWWKATGPYSASGKFPLLPLNSLGVKVTRQLFYKIRVGFGGGLMYGKSQTNSYFGYESHARMYWEDQLNLGTPLLNTWKAGGHATFSGLSAKERFGGGDWIKGGAFGGLGGTLSLMDGAERFDWFSEFAVMPMNIGRVGYDGSRHSVESASGWAFKLGAMRQQKFNNIQLGGSLETTDDRQTLNNGRRYHMEEWRLSVLATVAF